MHLPNPFGKRSSRQASRQHRERRLVVEGLEARQMLNVDPGSITVNEDLDVVDFIRRVDLDLTAGDIWYSAEAGRDGFFSLEAAIADSTSDATLTLYDSGGEQLAISTESGDPQRLDWEAEEADTFLVRISGSSSDVDLTLANLVTQIGDTVTVADTAGDDHFIFSTGSKWRRITINDLVYDFHDPDGSNILFTAGEGHDTATLYDSAGDDTFDAGPGLATLSSDSYFVSVSGAENVQAYALSGGVDTAKLHDSTGDDTFVSASDFGKLYGEDFFIRAKSFDYVHGYAKAGGNDRAKMFDSRGRDSFKATPTYCMMSGVVKETEFFARAKLFETVRAYATAGSGDFADLHGSDGDDTLTAGRYQAKLSGQDSEGRDFSISIQNFAVTRAYDYSGGFDVAHLYDTKYYEVFEARPDVGTLYGTKLYLLARGFDEVHAHSGEYGGDVAHFYDSPGNDLFVGKAEDGICKLEGDGFFLRAKAFDRVYAESTAGGNDSAELVDSSADEFFKAFDNWARISSTAGGIDYLYKVTGFDPVLADSSYGGTDTSDIDSEITFDLVDNWN